MTTDEMNTQYTQYAESILDHDDTLRMHEHTLTYMAHRLAEFPLLRELVEGWQAIPDREARWESARLSWPDRGWWMRAMRVLTPGSSYCPMPKGYARMPDLCTRAPRFTFRTLMREARRAQAFGQTIPQRAARGWALE